MLFVYKEIKLIIQNGYNNDILNISIAKGNTTEHNVKYSYQKKVAILKYKEPSYKIKNNEFFGDTFIRNNVKKCKLIIFNKEMELEPNLSLLGMVI